MPTNMVAKGRVISVVKHIGSGGREVTPHDTWTSGYNVQLVNLISGRIDLATKLAGEDIAGDVMRVVIASGLINQPVSISGQIVYISGQVVNISGQEVRISGQTVQVEGTVSISGQPIRISGQVVNISEQRVLISGQAVVVSGQPVAISGQVINISEQRVLISGQSVVVSGQTITINSAQSKSGLHGISGRPLLTNILDSNIQASYPPSLWRIQTAIGNTGQLTAKITNLGGISGYAIQTVSLNDGVNLTSGSLYIFDIINQSGDELNLQYNTSAPINVLRIHEITAGTQ